MLATTSDQADPAQGLAVFVGMFLFATIGVAVIAAIVEPRRRSRLGLPPFAFAGYTFGAGFSGGPDEWVTASAKALRPTRTTSSPALAHPGLIGGSGRAGRSAAVPPAPSRDR